MIHDADGSDDTDGGWLSGERWILLPFARSLLVNEPWILLPTARSLLVNGSSL